MPKAFNELYDAYYNSLKVLMDNGYHSISFPLINSGIFGGGLKHPVAESTKQCMDKLITQIAAIVRECGDIVLQADRGHVGVDAKAGHANFVTAYDRQVQQILQEKLLKLLPEAVFVGEEEDIHASIQNGFAFIVDPIDGTTNFIRDYHVSAISVGLAKDGERYIGVVYNPYLDEMFTAKRGEGAYLNGQPIHVSNRSLKDGIVIFGTAPYYEEYAEESFRLAYEYFHKCVDVRRN